MDSVRRKSEISRRREKTPLRTDSHSIPEGDGRSSMDVRVTKKKHVDKTTTPFHDEIKKKKKKVRSERNSVLNTPESSRSKPEYYSVTKLSSDAKREMEGSTPPHEHDTHLVGDGNNGNVSS